LDINPDIRKAWKGKSIAPLIPILLKTSILPESRRRIDIKKTEKQLKKKALEEKQLKEIDFFRDYLNNTQIDAEVLEKLEDTYGTVRLCILSEDGDEVFETHGFSSLETEIFRKDTLNMRHITLNIFDKPRKYAVMVDSGTEKFAQ